MGVFNVYLVLPSFTGLLRIRSNEVVFPSFSWT